jgi:hypothetical protein
MAIWDFRPRGDLWTGVAVGAGLLAAPVVIPLAWSATKSVLKTILKGGFMFYETGRQVWPEAAEGPARRQVRVMEQRLPAPVRRMKRDEETEEELIGKVRAVEERARRGRAKPKPLAPKQRKKAEKEK